MSDERRFYFEYDAEEFAAELDKQSKEAWRYTEALCRYRHAAKAARFYSHEVLWARLAVDLASLAALARQDALTDVEDEAMAAIVLGNSEEE